MSDAKRRSRPAVGVSIVGGTQVVNCGRRTADVKRDREKLCERFTTFQQDAHVAGVT